MGTDNMPYDTRVDWEWTRNVVNCWEVTDTLDQQSLPSTKNELEKANAELVATLKDAVRAHRTNARAGLRSILYVGKLNRKVLAHYFATKLGKDPDEWDATNDLDVNRHGSVCLFSVEINGFGIAERVRTSRLIYAAKVLKSKQSFAGADFSRSSEGMLELESEIARPILINGSETALSSINEDMLNRAISVVLDCFDRDLLHKIAPTITHKDSYDYKLIQFGKSQQYDFLDSEGLLSSEDYFHEDLAAAVKALSAHRPIPGERFYLLQDYARGVPTLPVEGEQERVVIPTGGLDILAPQSSKQALEFYRDALKPSSAPQGSWPSAHLPSLLQQTSINLASRLTCPIENRGRFSSHSMIMSIDGPPGTGKSTLLKDVVSDLNVKKALALCNLPVGPGIPFEDAFKWEPLPGNSNSKRPSSYYCVFKEEYDEINSYGALLCSNSNTAAANISKEWGLVSTLISDLDIKTEVGENPVEKIPERLNLEGIGPLPDNEGPDIFFGSPFRPAGINDKGKETPSREATWGLMGATLGKFDNTSSFFGGPFKQVIEQLNKHDDPDPLASFLDAKDEFLEQYEKVTNWQLELDSLASSTREETAAKRDAEIAQLQDDLNDLKRPISSLFHRSEIAEKSRELDLLKETSPIERAISELNLQDDEIPPTIDTRFFRGIISSDTDDPHRKAVHSSNPSACKKLNSERQRLFLLSLQVIKRFVLASPQIKNNLKLLSFFYSSEGNGNETYSDRTASREALFQSLMLLVPVVSTTFHSVTKLLGPNTTGTKKIPKHGAAPFGLLIVDEAGQALPHMAVGALSRCRSALIVGDPEQITPIQRPGIDDIETSVAKRYNVRVDNKQSVQTIADAQNIYGTLESSGWKGLPLLVHRRCLSPMFEISNNLAYGGRMIQATDVKGSHPPYLYEESRWINVAGEATERQSVREQTNEAVGLIIKHLQAQRDLNGKDSSKLYVITPFKAVAQSIVSTIKGELKHDPTLEAQCNAEHLRHYLSLKKQGDIDPYVGTVHSFQGKEADEVVLVLGCDARTLGAANWVERENILNVAVSRARCRFYVIGDISTWEHTRYQVVAKEIYERLTKDQVRHALEPLRHDGSITTAGAKALMQAMPVELFLSDMRKCDASEDDSTAQRSPLAERCLSTWFSAEIAKSINDKYVSERTPFGSLDEVRNHLSAADDDKGQIKSGMKDFERLLLFDWLASHIEIPEVKGAFTTAACHQLGLVAEWYLARAYRKTFPECMKRINPKANVLRITLGTPGRFLGSPEDAASFAQLTRSAAKNGTSPNAAIADQPLEKWWKGFTDEAKIVARVRNDANHTRLDELTVDDYEKMRHAVFFDKPAGPDSNLGTFFTEEEIPRTLRENLEQLGTLPLTEAQPVRFSQGPKDGMEPRAINTNECRRSKPASIVEKGAQASGVANRRPEPSEYVSLSKYISKLMNEKLMQKPRPSISDLNAVLGAQGYIKTEDPKLPTEKGKSVGLGTEDGINEKTGELYTIATYPLPPSEPVLSVVLEAVRQVQGRK